MAKITGDQLAGLLIATIMQEWTGAEMDWPAIIGPVHQLRANDTSNWVVKPGGNPAQRSAINRAVDIVRQAHPFIAETSTIKPRFGWHRRRRLSDT